jgi:hypothetical protein
VSTVLITWMLSSFMVLKVECLGVLLENGYERGLVECNGTFITAYVGLRLVRARSSLSPGKDNAMVGKNRPCPTLFGVQ